MLKKIVNKYFESFSYFYSHLRYRIFVVVAFSIFIGVLDGFGLSMFLPLLKVVNNSEGSGGEETSEQLEVLVNLIEGVGLELNLVTVLTFMVFFFLAKGIIQYFSSVYRINVQQWFVEKIRVNNIKGLNRLAYKYFVQSDVGRIQNTMTGEVDRVAGAYFNYFKAFEYSILVVVYMVFAFTMNAQFAILVTIGGGVTNFLYKRLYKTTKILSRDLTGENNNFQSLVIQNVTNYKYLKATGFSNSYGKKLIESVLEIKNNNIKIGKLDALLTSGREPILIIVVVLVIWIQLSFFNAEFGPILISLLFFYRALNYLMQMQVRWNKFLSVSGSLENMQEFMQELKQHRETTGSDVIKDNLKDIHLKDVEFKYGNTKILDSLSLSIENKESIAFVGESGSGKTTLINIIAGLLPINGGNYSINGINYANLQNQTYQKRIGYITQDPVIFNETIFNNITLWQDRTSNNLELFWEVVKKAALFDFVNTLPEKENTVLENNGANLSGGQKQRISIARELFKDIDVLILDEATSALDSETENIIQRNIDSLKGQYTVIIVAHRISTIKNADRIVIMKNGQITEIGKYEDLIDKSEYFSKLVELQEL